MRSRRTAIVVSHRSKEWAPPGTNSRMWVNTRRTLLKDVLGVQASPQSAGIFARRYAVKRRWDSVSSNFSATESPATAWWISASLSEMCPCVRDHRGQSTEMNDLLYR
jgi:hypothetical protein